MEVYGERGGWNEDPLGVLLGGKTDGIETLLTAIFHVGVPSYFNKKRG